MWVQTHYNAGVELTGVTSCDGRSGYWIDGILPKIGSVVGHLSDRARALRRLSVCRSQGHVVLRNIGLN